MTERFRPTATAYNVLCPGPSAPSIRQQDLLDGPTVAINAAIATDLPVWCWAMTDNPYNLYESFPQAYQRRDLWFFTLDCWLWHWERLGVEVTRLFSVEAIQIMLPDANGEMRPVLSRRGHRGGMPTIIKVLGWLVSCLGAREIKILGADMHGKGSPWTPYCRWQPSPQEDSDRWELERFLVSRAIRKAREFGCTVYRHDHEEAAEAA